MRILLLQDEIYLPSLGGGTKVNRYLLRGFARQGHTCMAITPALTRSPDGPNTRAQLIAESALRQTELKSLQPDVFAYQYEGVHVQAGDWPSDAQASDHVLRQLEAFQPDWVFVADDKRKFMLESAVKGAPGRVVVLVQTIVQLPFGPLAVERSQRQTELMSNAQAIIVISSYLNQYIRTYSQLDCHLLQMPVYGDGPFPDLAQFDAGFITMINPCELKGVAIFMALAREFTSLQFAAVPTWGADEKTLLDLKALPNVCILTPDDDIEKILAQTRVLLVPSLWPETFGYVVPEAMVRGIPVLASNVGGLPEAKLGVDYVLPVTPIKQGEHLEHSEQNVEPWSQALSDVTSNAETYARCSRQSREAALPFVAQASITPFEMLLTKLATSSP